MKNRSLGKTVSFCVLLLLVGCSRAQDETDPDVLLDAFLADEIPAYHLDGEQETPISFELLPPGEGDWESYSVGERLDLDNDGEAEQILNGPYGGVYLDARDGKVYVLASGEGTAGILDHTYHDGAVWIVHSDTTHAGRQYFWLTKYDGGDVVDSAVLSAQYWDAVSGSYDETSDFTYRDEAITMEEYEALRKEIIGW